MKVKQNCFLTYILYVYSDNVILNNFNRTLVENSIKFCFITKCLRIYDSMMDFNQCPYISKQLQAWLHKLTKIEVTFCAKWFNEHFCCFKFANV